MIWFLLSLMLAGAVLSIAWPLVRSRRFLMLGVSAAIVIAVSIGLYAYQGSPRLETATVTADAVPSVDEMVVALEQRLQSSPEDLNGWKMLGRSQMELGRPAKAVEAFERAVALEDGQNGETLISLGEAMMAEDQASIGGRAGQVIESGLALVPNSPRGLFYGGFSALQRGDQALAADRWEALLATGPPPEVRPILEQRIAEWRGEPPPAEAAQAATPATTGKSVSVDISLGENRPVTLNGTLFVIARDPASPSPPLAVVRHSASELPGTIEIGDQNAMIAGRVPSAFDQLEIVVRVSQTGQPIPQSGDWFGQALFRWTDGEAVAIVIDQQVP